MARNEWEDEILPLFLRGIAALAFLFFLVVGAVGTIGKWKRMGAGPVPAQGPDRKPGDEVRAGGPAPGPAVPVVPSGPAPVPAPPSGPAPLASGPAPLPTSPPAPPALKPGVWETAAAGGAFAKNDYREARPDGALLVGFDIGFGKALNTDVITALRPIWLTANGEEYGEAYGRTRGPLTTVRAKSGYAVGGIVIAGGGALEGFCLTFMRIGTKSLVATDAYTSDWYGERTRRPRPEAMRSGDGGFVIGLYGKRFDDTGGFTFDACGAIGTIGLVLWVKE